MSFYVDALELEKPWEFVSEDEVTNVYVAGESDTEIQFKHDPEKPAPEQTEFDHTTIAVNDTDAEVEQLIEETGCTVRRGPLTSEARTRE